MSAYLSMLRTAQMRVGLRGQPYRVSFSEGDLRRYAMDVPMPGDFERLMKSLEEISADR